MRLIACAAALLLCACIDDAEWSEARWSYACTVEQMERVQNETLWCIEHVRTQGHYCFGTAIMRVCEPKPVQPKATKP